MFVSAAPFSKAGIEDYRDLVGADRLDALRARARKLAGLKVDDEVVDGLATQAVEHAIRVAAERSALEQLGEAKQPTIEIPDLTDGVDVAALYEIADLLVEMGVR
jgi:predicted phosphoribosyltransferase